MTQPPERPALEAEAIAALDALIEAGVRRRGGAGVWSSDRRGAVATGLAGGPRTLPILDLRETCARMPEATWRTNVGHFLRVHLAPPDREALDPADFGAAREKLRLRLWPRQGEGLPPETVGLPVMPGVDALLVVDHPDRAEAVRPVQFEAWGLALPDVLGLALGATLAEDVQPETVATEDGLRLVVFESTSIYAATFPLALERFVVAPAGAIVIVPHRHLAMAHVIEDERAIEAMYRLWAIAQEAADEAGDAALSRDVYWWTPGRFTRIELRESVPPHGVDAESGLALLPPPEMLDALKRLLDANA